MGAAARADRRRASDKAAAGRALMRRKETAIGTTPWPAAPLAWAVDVGRRRRRLDLEAASRDAVREQGRAHREMTSGDPASRSRIPVRRHSVPRFVASHGAAGVATSTTRGSVKHTTTAAIFITGGCRVGQVWYWKISTNRPFLKG